MKISALPLEALLAKMTAGFNDALAAVAVPVYGVKPFSVDFPDTIYSENTSTFLFGKISPEDIDTFGPSGLTKFTMFIDLADNANFEKPRDFSGTVKVGLDCHIGHVTSNMRQNFNALSLAVEDAVAEVIQPYRQQNWGPGVIYNGGFTAIPGTVYVPVKGQGSLRQLLAFRLDFQVNVGG